MMMVTKIYVCDRCEEEFEADPSDYGGLRPQVCEPCSWEIEAEGMANIEPPEGGWPRNSQMDRL